MTALAQTSAARRVDEPLLPGLLRPLVYVMATATFAYPLSTPLTALCAAVGAGIGAVLGRVIAGTRFRLPSIVLFAGALLGLTLLARDALLASTELSHALGPAGALATGAGWAWFAGALCVAVAVRASALRLKVFRVLEVAFIGAAFAQLVVGHRGGAINRPFELADSIIAQGGDPTLALLCVGAVAAAACVILLLSERSPLRSFLHMVLAFALLALVLLGSSALGLPQPKLGASGLGLRPGEQGEKQQRREQQGGHGQQRQSSNNENEDLRFEDNYDTSGKQIPLAVVLLHDDYSPPTGLYYFRQTAMSQYNGHKLVQATRADVDKDIANGFVFEPTKIADVPNEQGDRVRLETTVALLADHNRPFGLESPVEVRPERNPDPARFRRAYRVVSEALDSDFDTLLERGVGNPSWSEEQIGHYTSAPKDPRYGDLAKQIVAAGPEWARDNKVAQGFLVSLWLSKQGIYSLKSNHAAAEDPTADFLFGDKTGYCVHFAHAAVYLMRSLGIPARVGAGYVVEESARQGGSAILLSGANSHAWPEMYVTGVGWVIADVSPERSLDPAVQPPDADLQQLLGEMARGLKPLPQSEWRPLEPALGWLRKLPARVARVLALVIPVLLLLGYGVKLWRRLSPFWARGKSAPRVAYRAQLDRLSELSIRRRFGESREAFAARAAAHNPTFRELTQTHVAALFARDPAASTLRRPRELLRSAALELARAVPYQRRLLGALNPFSWLASR